MNFWNKLLSKLSSLFKDGKDHLWSSTRFAFIITVILSNLSFWGVWIGLSVYRHELQPIPDSVVVIYCLANGIASSLKLIQKPMESK